MSLPASARYFPVKDGPLRMEAGLLRHGSVFGNGAADALFFQVDDELDRYLAAKRVVRATRHAHTLSGRCWLCGGRVRPSSSW